jgi:hypothetical protein
LILFDKEMSKMQEAPPPYPQPPDVNNYGPPQNPGGQPYMGQPYMGPPYGGGQPIIIMQQQQQQQQQQPQQVIVRARGTNHGLCCLICILTGGMSIPCWMYSCITD